MFRKKNYPIGLTCAREYYSVIEVALKELNDSNDIFKPPVQMMTKMYGLTMTKIWHINYTQR